MKDQATFGANKLATTVGANHLANEMVVSQPRIQIPVLEEVEFEFDQAKYEEFLSSSSRSSSPRKAKPFPARKRKWASESESEAEIPSSTAADLKLGSEFPAPTPSMQGVGPDGVPALSKRAKQRRRQAMARRFARAMQSTDGVRYEADLRKRSDPRWRSQVVAASSSKPPTEEWIRVKRTKSTLQERIRKRRAIKVRARALVQQAQKLKQQQVVAKPPPTHLVWRPKPNASTAAPSAPVQRALTVQAPQFPVQAPRITALRQLPSRAPHAPTPSRRAINASALRQLPSQAPRALVPRQLLLQPPTAGIPRPLPAPAPSTQTQLPATAETSRSKVPIKERLGPMKRPHTTGGHIGLRIQVQKPAKTSRPQRRTWRRVTFENSDTISSESDSSYPKGPSHSTIGCSGIHADDLYYSAGGTNRTRRRHSLEVDTCCPCSQLIRAVMESCTCSICDEAPQRKGSVFDRLGTRVPPSRSRQSRRGSLPRNGEVSRVTVNMAGKETPSRALPETSQRLTRLKTGTIRRSNYKEVQRGVTSQEETSDIDSAVASDNTVSSEGQPQEALMVSADQVAKMLEEALAKQKEDLKVEMYIAMQEIRAMHDQQVQVLIHQQAESGRRDNANPVDSDTEGEEEPPSPRNHQNTGGSRENAGGNGGNASGNTTVPPQSHPSGDTGDSEKIRELESKINTLISAQEVKKTGIPCPYPREWESIPYPAKFNLINFTPFDGRGSPTQHLIYFKSHLGVISGNEPLMVRSFVGTLRGAAFDWYRRLKAGSINSWDDMETRFLANFFDDDNEISIGALLDEKQRNGETVDAFVKRFRNKAMNCRDPITEEFIIQTCHNNLSIEVLEAMGITPSTTWRDLKVRGEQAERFLKRKKAERGQQAANAPVQSFATSSKGKPRAKMVEAKQTLHKQKSSEPRFPKTYAFRDDEVPGIFKYLLENNKIQLPPIDNQEEAKMVTDPKYCAYHRAVHHPTRACYQLKDKIQALVEVGVITPKPGK